MLKLWMGERERERERERGSERERESETVREKGGNNEQKRAAPQKWERCYNRCGQTFSVSSRRSLQPLISCINTPVPSLLSPPNSPRLSSITSCYIWLSAPPPVSLHLCLSHSRCSLTPPHLFFFIWYSSRPLPLFLLPLFLSISLSLSLSFSFFLPSLSLFLSPPSLSLSLSAAVSHSDLHIFNSN